MKKQLVNVLTKIGFLSVMGFVTAVGSAHGQSLADKLRASIPFDFIVADKKVPAGDYYIGRANPNVGDSLLLIRSLDGHSQTIRPTIPVITLAAKDRGVLVFHRYGDQYFLFQVWPAGATTGRVMPKSRSEREIERKLATNSSAVKMARKAGTVETATIAGGLQ
jgi:hypothetical protein